MKESDLQNAADMLKNKNKVEKILKDLGKPATGESTRVHVEDCCVDIRQSCVKEFLEKELNYINRMLKSLGTTEIK